MLRCRCFQRHLHNLFFSRFLIINNFIIHIQVYRFFWLKTFCFQLKFILKKMCHSCEFISSAPRIARGRCRIHCFVWNWTINSNGENGEKVFVFYTSSTWLLENFIHSHKKFKLHFNFSFWLCRCFLPSLLTALVSIPRQEICWSSRSCRACCPLQVSAAVSSPSPSLFQDLTLSLATRQVELKARSSWEPWGRTRNLWLSTAHAVESTGR